MLAAGMPAAGQVARNKFAVRINGDIVLTNPYTAEYNFPVHDDTNSMNNFGAEFIWSFWQAGQHRLELGTGFGLQKVNFTAETDDVSYSYVAPSSADMDGNSYIRYTDLSAMKQTISMSRIAIPLYLRYNCDLNSRWSLYGKAGIMISLGGKANLSKISGSTDSYGVYPEYGNLVIDEPWLNEFGERTLTKEQCIAGKTGGTDFGILAGAGVSFQVIKPIYISVGLTYQRGFANMLKGDGLKVTNGMIDNTQAPVTYTVADGIQYRQLTDGLTKCKLNRLGIEFGVEFRF